MATTKTNTAIQSLKDIQQQIETFEEEWAKANKAGDREKIDNLDRIIERLLATRHGMETILSDLGIKFNRKDYRTIDLNGNMTFHTLWYLI